MINSRRNYVTNPRDQLLSARISSNLFQNRDVLRAGWLKYIPFAEKPSDDHKFWVVFAVYDSNTPYLEFYQKRQVNVSVSSDGPVSKHSLLNCRHISSVITVSQECGHFEFAITLETHTIRLAADCEEVMFDWIDSLRTKLVAMKILTPSENFYSKCPTTDCISSFGLNSTEQSANEAEGELYEPIFDLSNNLRQVTLNQIVPTEEGPPPYERIFHNSTNSQRSSISFREAQVEKLKKEMQLVSGMKLNVRKKDCYNAIAFVDIAGHGIFVAGWKQKDHPHLHNTFHIGDQLVSINGEVIESALHAKDVIKQCSHVLEVTVRRIPFGQVFCLKRSFEGQDLGLTREKGTAEISAIVPNGLAAKAGLLSECTYDTEGEESIGNQHWCLTEINNRPLNLFFKNNELADRLNAIGKEISILVQPYCFVKKLRKQLKTFKNYKDYIVQ